MLKYKNFVFILLIVVFISGNAYAEQEIKDRQVRTMEGKVTYVDPESGILKVQNDEGEIVLSLTVESYILRFTKPMASIEIEKGDPVTIQYTVSSGKYIIQSLVDSQPVKD